MFTIPLISTNTKLYGRLKAIIASRAQDFYEPLLLTNIKAA
jgi:hypothetical protein